MELQNVVQGEDGRAVALMDGGFLVRHLPRGMGRALVPVVQDGRC